MNPTEAKALSLLSAMRQGKRHTRPGKLPGDGAVFSWQVLTRAEKQECLAAAIGHFAKLGIPAELRAFQDLEDEVVTQVLARAMRDPSEPSRSFAKDVDEIRELLTVDEIDLLFNGYADVEDEVNPDPAALSDELRDAIEAALKKADERALTSFGARSLGTYMLSLASRPSSSPKDSSITGSAFAKPQVGSRPPGVPASSG
jgi:hypothetical protein